jgi:xylulokinase
MACVLGIDIGTSSTKALVCDGSGRVLGTGASPHETATPRPGWSEQDPDAWWQATAGAVRAALEDSGVAPEAIAAVGLSGQMHGSVLLDERALGSPDGPALRPALLWNDQRTGPQCQELERRAGGRRAMVEMVGNAALPGFTLPKLLWVRQHEPEVWSRVRAWCLPKDFVRLRLTGQLATDPGDAAGTLLLDVERRDWSQDAHQLADLDPALAPPVLESCAPAGRITPHAASHTGLAEGTPVVAGSGDNQCGAAGAGVVAPGLVLAALGTSGVIYAHAPEARLDLGTNHAPAGRVHTMCAADGDAARAGHWALTGCMLSAAGSLAWLRETLFPDTPYDRLFEEAAASPAGSRGLLFLPHLTGERCPHPDPAARGAFVGLTSRHARGDLVRAVLEGVTLTMRQILDIFRSVGVEPARVRLGGGGARTALWRGLQADIYGLPVELPNTEEGPAFGAALMAGVGAGLWESLDRACAETLRITDRAEPDPQRAALYDDLLGVHAPVYAALRPTNTALKPFDR